MFWRKFHQRGEMPRGKNFKPIGIDGGAYLDNLEEVVRADCDWIVTESAVFHSAHAAATVRQLR